jgi:hypothetical protein
MPSRQVHDTIDSELGHRGSKRFLPMTAIDMAAKRTLTARFKAVAMSRLHPISLTAAAVCRYKSRWQWADVPCTGIGIADAYMYALPSD